MKKNEAVHRDDIRAMLQLRYTMARAAREALRIGSITDGTDISRPTQIAVREAALGAIMEELASIHAELLTEEIDDE